MLTDDLKTYGGLPPTQSKTKKPKKEFHVNL